jgi:DNA-binding NarL/FixJ family response regulator
VVITLSGGSEDGPAAGVLAHEAPQCRSVILTTCGRPGYLRRAMEPGATVSEIAGKLFLSEGTVRNYLSAAIAKTGTRNRSEAVRLAEERGWL